MSNWSRMEKELWVNSEIFQELEKLVRAALNVEDDKDSEKESLAQNVDQVSNKVKQISQSIQDANKEMKNFVGTLSNLAKDEEGKDSEKDSDENKEDSKESISDEEHDEAKGKLYVELYTLSMYAADEGRYKLAYKIERLIDELFLEE